MAGQAVAAAALPSEVSLRPIGPRAESLFSADLAGVPGRTDGLVASRDGRVIGAVLATSRQLLADDESHSVLQILEVRTDVTSLGPPLLEATCRRCAPADALAALDETGTATTWRPLAPPATVVRIHRPGRTFDLPGGRVLDRCVHRGVRAADRVRALTSDLRRSIDVAPVDVVASNDVPADLLAELHADVGEAGVRFERNRETLADLKEHRRFRTYVGYRHGTPAGAALVERGHGVTVADVAPPGLPRTDPTVMDAILRAVVEEHRDVPVIRSTDSVLGRTLCQRWGFADVDRIPLRWWWPRRHRAVRSLDPSRPPRIGSYALDEPDGWHVTPLDGVYLGRPGPPSRPR